MFRLRMANLDKQISKNRKTIVPVAVPRLAVSAISALLEL